MPFVAVNKARKLEWQDTRPPEGELRSAYAIAAKNQPALVRAFNALVKAFQTPAFLSSITTLIRRGTAADANTIANSIGSIEDEPWASALHRFQKVFAKIIEDSGTSTARRGVELPKRFIQKARVKYSFDLDNPFSVRWIEEHATELIAGINAETKEQVRQIILEGYNEGIPPKKTAAKLSEEMFLTKRDAEAMQRAKALNVQDLMRDKYVTMEDGTRKLVRRGVSRERAEELADRIASQFAGGKTSLRASRIARTETIAAEAKGVQDSWQAATDQGVMAPGAMQVWIAAGMSERTCPICLDLDGQEAELGGTFHSNVTGADLTGPPGHVMCLLGDALVSAHSVSAATKRIFKGDIIVVRTASGNELPCTPNHPILTNNGWVPAGRLRPGFKVVSHGNPVGFSLAAHPDKKHMPSGVHHASHFFAVSGSALTKHVPTSPQDFHGDGMPGEVAVVNINSLLEDQVIDADALASFQKRSLMRGVNRGLPFSGFRYFQRFLTRTLSAAHGFMGGFCEPHALLFAGIGHANHHALAAATGFDSIFSESFANNASTDSEFFGESLFANARDVFLNDRSGIKFHSSGSGADPSFGQPIGNDNFTDAELFGDGSVIHPREIFFDNVVDLGFRKFDGHVFNLETADGHYVANGLLTHNCRCSVGLQFPEE